MIITIKPNASFRKAIEIAFAEACADTSKSYQFVNIEPFYLKRNEKTIKVVINKIRISFAKGKWDISELVFAEEGSFVPTTHHGDYELLSEFTYDFYG